MTMVRASIRGAAIEAIADEVDSGITVEADSGYAVAAVPCVRVGWSEDAPKEMQMNGGTVYVLGLLVSVFHALGPSALDAVDDIQEDISAAVASLVEDPDLSIVQIMPPTATVVQDGGGEQNHVHLEIEYPVQYWQA